MWPEILLWTALIGLFVCGWAWLGFVLVRDGLRGIWRE